jgi:RNAse (barnase) inhibitor barstar
MTDSLHTLIASGSSGVFRRHPRQPAGPVLAADLPGFSVVEIGLEPVQERKVFFQRMAEALEFPAHFGHNLDAFYDCLTDLAGRCDKGLLLVLRGASGFARGKPEEFGAAVDVLIDAADYWKAQGKSLVAVIELDQAVLAPELPEISEP